LTQNNQPLDLEEALHRIRQSLTPASSTEIIDLTAARQRILAIDVIAPVSLPPFPASAMDGYALSLPQDEAVGSHPYTVVGASLAGHPWTGTLSAKECVRVFTGALVPNGANQVIPQEEVANNDLEAQSVRFKPHQPSESFVRGVGHDIEQGQTLLPKGTRLSAFALGSLAAAGISRVSVFRQLSVGVFSTGDELVELGVEPTDLKPGQIYDSNRFTVLNLLADEPCELHDLGCIPDDQIQTTAAIRDAAARHDVLITSGGVSVGDADFVTNTIRNLGELNFWKLNLKPGKPLALGRVDDCWIFGLPGNPVSTIITLLLITKPALAHLAGQANNPQTVACHAALTQPIQHAPGRKEFQRGIATETINGIEVSSTGDQSSNRLSSFTRANCLIALPKDKGDLPTGTQVQIYPFHGLLG